MLDPPSGRVMVRLYRRARHGLIRLIPHHGAQRNIGIVRQHLMRRRRHHLPRRLRHQPAQQLLPERVVRSMSLWSCSIFQRHVPSVARTAVRPCPKFSIASSGVGGGPASATSISTTAPGFLRPSLHS